MCKNAAIYLLFLSKSKGNVAHIYFSILMLWFFTGLAMKVKKHISFIRDHATLSFLYTSYFTLLSSFKPKKTRLLHGGFGLPNLFSLSIYFENKLVILRKTNVMKSFG